MSVRNEIEERLTAAFAPEVLEIQDDSEKHRGHGGWREGGETHFNVTIRAPALAALGRVERHRAVHRALGDLTTRIHALALDIG
ncbi:MULTISPECIES: BolA family transcriptional regulator [Gemmobacter]|jgi:BolA protein|uniref:BolA protein n=2 Tax=Gemmobacter TaxID=204456 RepID=A0A2T6AS54_9RHOB|nr:MULTISPECIES: BolA family protein [Gemmobacter]OJY25450.1 MAG: BolA family transcriptional regulator [Rhodobacterales bacterium 65-51]PTX46620.1 BolA protein [Gemmobacter caeni]TWI95469.1 BolA protein [Gemmobacter caeni]GHC23282.1 BolA family transcriptional regulator [Gemmobacter nanjingensis]